MPTSTTTRAGRAGAQVADSATTQGREVASRASEEARSVAATAGERSSEIVEVAKQETQSLVGTARQRAGEVTEQVSSQAQSLLDDTRTQVEQQVQAGVTRLAGGLREFGSQAQALAEGRPEEAPTLTDYAFRAADNCYGAADKLHSVAQRVEEDGLGGVLDDLQTFARRRPGAFLVGAVAVGFGVGRMVKAQRSGGEEQAGITAGTSSARAGGRTRPAPSSGNGSGNGSARARPMGPGTTGPGSRPGVATTRPHAFRAESYEDDAGDGGYADQAYRTPSGRATQVTDRVAR